MGVKGRLHWAMAPVPPLGVEEHWERSCQASALIPFWGSLWPKDTLPSRASLTWRLTSSRYSSQDKAFQPQGSSCGCLRPLLRPYFSLKSPPAQSRSLFSLSRGGVAQSALPSQHPAPRWSLLLRQLGLQHPVSGTQDHHPHSRPRSSCLSAFDLYQF